MSATASATTAPAEGPSARPERRWLPAIESVRAVAAVTVVIHHCWALSTQPHFFGWQVLAGLGTWGVDLFFLLSAFLLPVYFWDGKKKSVRSFYIRRLLRIAPAYYVCVALLFMFFAEHRLVSSSQGVTQILANATFTHWFFPTTSSSLNVDGALWTLSIEMALYLTLPLMALAFARRPVLVTASLIVAGVAYRAYVTLWGGAIARWYFGPDSAVPHDVQRVFLSRQFLGYLPIFGLGMAARWAYEKGLFTRRRSEASLWPLVALLLPSLAFLGLIVATFEPQPWALWSVFELALALLMVPALVYAASSSSMRRSAAGRASAWVGRRSYSLYLWHFPVILSVYGVGPMLNPPPTSFMWVRIALVLSISMAVAAVSYRAIEEPGVALGRRLTGREEVPQSGFA